MRNSQYTHWEELGVLFFLALLLGAGAPFAAEALRNGRQGQEAAIAHVAFQEQLARIEKARQRGEMPEMVKGIYLSSWTAGSPQRREALFDLVRKTELNAVVIDIKEVDGKIRYATEVQKAHELGLVDVHIRDLPELIEKLQGEGVWVIARQALFQDVALAEARPDLAVKDKRTGAIWRNRKNLAWVDSSSREVWEYNLALAKEALRLGFDEIQFDYVRFPSDGSLSNIAYPLFDETMPKYRVIGEFFKYAREELGEHPFSVDLFGMTFLKVETTEDDLNIGQRVKDAVPYADAISPMVYPSHYPSGFEGFVNPALYPREVVGVSLREGKQAFEGPNVRAKVRPWLQDFDLGAVYTPAMVRAQIDVAEEEGAAGWLLWSPRNTYTVEALKPAGEPESLNPKP